MVAAAEKNMGADYSGLLRNGADYRGFGLGYPRRSAVGGLGVRAKSVGGRGGVIQPVPPVPPVPRPVKTRDLACVKH